MAGIKIALVEDVTSFLRGISKSEDALDDLSGSLDDLARDAQRAGRDTGEELADGVEHGTDEATDSVQRLERSFREMSKSVSKDAAKAGDDIGDKMRRGTDRANEGVHEMGREAESTAKESAASFDGSAESIADSFQEIAANAFAGFGPAGAAAGVAVALGLGVAITALQTAADEANALTEDAVELSNTLANPDLVARSEELAQRWSDLADSVSDVRSVWEVWQPRAVTLIEDLAAAAHSGAFDVTALMDSFDDPNPVTRLKGLKEAVKQLQEVEEEEKHKRDTNTESQKDFWNQTKRAREAVEEEVRAQEAAVAILEAKARALGMTTEEYQRQEDATAQALQVQEAYKDAIKDTADPVSTYEGILDRKNEAERVAAQNTVDTNDVANDSWEDYAKDVTVTTDDLIAEWNRQADEAVAFRVNLAEIAAAGGQALADELRAKGPEIAGAVAATIAQADPAVQQQAIEAHARATGQKMGTAMATGITDQQTGVQQSVNTLASNITSPSIPVRLVPDSTALDQLLLRPRTMVVNVNPGTVVGGGSRVW